MRFLIFLLFFVFSCTSSPLRESSNTPILQITSVLPPSSITGSEIEITGNGFAIIPQKNILLIGGIAVAGNHYTVRDAQEVVSVILPDILPAGKTSIQLMNEGEVSNVFDFEVIPR